MFALFVRRAIAPRHYSLFTRQPGMRRKDAIASLLIYNYRGKRLN
ncbi:MULTISPECIES: hypothetical protein [Cyanophyceae]|nr:hypothetical protein [Trichocoleus sp. FACHB-40]